jgi:hypothetical protein
LEKFLPNVKRDFWKEEKRVEILFPSIHPSIHLVGDEFNPFDPTLSPVLGPPSDGVALLR